MEYVDIGVGLIAMLDYGGNGEVAAAERAGRVREIVARYGISRAQLDDLIHPLWQALLRIQALVRSGDLGSEGAVSAQHWAQADEILRFEVQAAAILYAAGLTEDDSETMLNELLFLLQVRSTNDYDLLISESVAN